MNTENKQQQLEKQNVGEKVQDPNSEEYGRFRYDVDHNTTVPYATKTIDWENKYVKGFAERIKESNIWKLYNDRYTLKESYYLDSNLRMETNEISYHMTDQQEAPMKMTFSGSQKTSTLRSDVIEWFHLYYHKYAPTVSVIWAIGEGNIYQRLLRLFNIVGVGMTDDIYKSVGDWGQFVHCEAVKMFIDDLDMGLYNGSVEWEKDLQTVKVIFNTGETQKDELGGDANEVVEVLVSMENYEADIEQFLLHGTVGKALYSTFAGWGTRIVHCYNNVKSRRFAENIDDMMFGRSLVDVTTDIDNDNTLYYLVLKLYRIMQIAVDPNLSLEQHVTKLEDSVISSLIVFLGDDRTMDGSYPVNKNNQGAVGIMRIATGLLKSLGRHTTIDKRENLEKVVLQNVNSVMSIKGRKILHLEKLLAVAGTLSVKYVKLAKTGSIVDKEGEEVSSIVATRPRPRSFYLVRPEVKKEMDYMPVGYLFQLLGEVDRDGSITRGTSIRLNPNFNTEPLSWFATIMSKYSITSQSLTAPLLRAYLMLHSIQAHQRSNSYIMENWNSNDMPYLRYLQDSNYLSSIWATGCGRYKANDPGSELTIPCRIITYYDFMKYMAGEMAETDGWEKMRFGDEIAVIPVSTQSSKFLAPMILSYYHYPWETRVTQLPKPWIDAWGGECTGGNWMNCMTNAENVIVPGPWNGILFVLIDEVTKDGIAREGYSSFWKNPYKFPLGPSPAEYMMTDVHYLITTGTIPQISYNLKISLCYGYYDIGSYMANINYLESMASKRDIELAREVFNVYAVRHNIQPSYYSDKLYPNFNDVSAASSGLRFASTLWGNGKEEYGFDAIQQCGVDQIAVVDDMVKPASTHCKIPKFNWMAGILLHTGSLKPARDGVNQVVEFKVWWNNRYRLAQVYRGMQDRLNTVGGMSFMLWNNMAASRYIDFTTANEAWKRVQAPFMHLGLVSQMTTNWASLSTVASELTSQMLFTREHLFMNIVAYPKVVWGDNADFDLNWSPMKLKRQQHYKAGVGMVHTFTMPDKNDFLFNSHNIGTWTIQRINDEGTFVIGRLVDGLWWVPPVMINTIQAKSTRDRTNGSISVATEDRLIPGGEYLPGLSGIHNSEFAYDIYLGSGSSQLLQSALAYELQPVRHRAWYPTNQVFKDKHLEDYDGYKSFQAFI